MIDRPDDIMLKDLGIFPASFWSYMVKAEENEATIFYLLTM